MAPFGSIGSKTTSYWFYIHRLGIIFLVVYLLVTFLCFCLSGYAISLKWCVYCFTCLENKKEAQLCKTASLQLQLNEAQDTTAFCVNDELVDLNVYGAVCYSFHNDLNHLMQTMSSHIAESFPVLVNNGHVLSVYPLTTLNTWLRTI